MAGRKLIMLGIVALFLAATIAMTLLGTKEEQAPTGFVQPIKGGRAGVDAYYLFLANGSGSARLVALGEKPKTSVAVLSEEGIDDETTNRFGEFVERMSGLEQYGMSVQVVSAADLRAIRESVIIIPSGAMPRYVLDDLGALHSRDNRIVYIGKTDFVLSRELRQDYWLAQLDNESREKLVVREMKLGDFLDARGEPEELAEEILKNEWAESAESDFAFSSFSGRKTLFVPLGHGGYYRFIYEAGGQKGIIDSQRMPMEPIEVTVTPSIYPWEKAELFFTVNQSAGKVLYTLEREGDQIAAEELGYVGSEKVFYYTFEFEEPGDYIFWVYDSSGMLGSAHMHVKRIDVSIVDVRDVRVIFNVTVDGVPVKSGRAAVSMDGDEEREFSIADGQMAVPARLRAGENNFRVRYLEYVETIPYSQKEEGLFDVYLKWLVPGLAVIAGVYVYASIRRRPVYTLRIEKMGKKKANTVWVAPGQVVDAIRDVEKSCGWKDVPVSLKELMQSFKKNMTDGADMYDGDVESLMKKMEERGLVERYGDYYQLRGWGDVRKNVMKRKARDALVLSGEKFRDAWGGFELDRFVVSTEYFNTDKHLILVFEDEEEKRRFLDSMEPLSRAEMDLKLENGKVTITTVDGLSEFI
ncbi:MAG: hypothetical protein AB1657_04865 [Candidatus Micrarchaeota archaeon]